MSNHLDLGRRGEDLAASYLEKEGYRIIYRNHRVKKLEIDIVARKGDLIIFAEVKTRSQPIEEMEAVIPWSKQQHLLNAADQFLAEQSEELEGRIDVITIHIQGENSQLTHRENAIQP